MKLKPQPATATYVFCLIRSRKKPGAARVPDALPGMSKPRIVEVGEGLYLAVSDAPLDRYDQKSIERGLQDLDWVSVCAMAHEQVVEYFAKAETIIPLKLFTLFLDEARAIAFVEASRPKLEATLDRIEGCMEFGIRIGFDEAKAADQARAGLGSSRPSGGADFLKAKKQLRDTVRELSTREHPRVDQAHEQLSAAVKESRRRPVTVANSSGKRLLLDGAYLVHHKAALTFQAEVQALRSRLQPEGYEVTLTGPWPPYNFIQEAG